MSPVGIHILSAVGPVPSTSKASQLRRASLERATCRGNIGKTRLHRAHSLQAPKQRCGMQGFEAWKPRKSYREALRPRERRVEVHTAIEADTDLQTHTETETFNWFKYWWPVQLCANLDTDRPNRIQLLGEFFAVWMNKEGEWVAMRDMCPHRLAPLSEGRIESDGTLMCSYHGWRFNSCGKCVKIPQADSDKAHEAACNNPRSEAQTLPCQARGGFLWIWPDASEDAALEANSTPLPIPPDLSDSLEKLNRENGYPCFTTRFPYGYEVTIENLMDPSHLPFAHHGVMSGMTRAKGKPLAVQQVPPTVPTAEYSFEYTQLAGGASYVERHGPNCTIVRYPKAENDKMGDLIFFITPIKDGECRAFTCAIPPAAIVGKQEYPGLFTRCIQKHFCWILHHKSQAITDGDSVFLHPQDISNRGSRELAWHSKMYHLPTSADLPIVNFRAWLTTVGGGGPFGHISKEKRSRLPTRREVLDRYNLHTSECKECQKGLKLVNRLIAISGMLSRCFLFLGALLAVHWMQHGSLMKVKLASVTVSYAVCTLFGNYLKKTILPRFYFVDYVHADKN